MTGGACPPPASYVSVEHKRSCSAPPCDGGRLAAESRRERPGPCRLFPGAPAQPLADRLRCCPRMPHRRTLHRPGGLVPRHPRGGLPRIRRMQDPRPLHAEGRTVRLALQCGLRTSPRLSRARRVHAEGQFLHRRIQRGLLPVAAVPGAGTLLAPAPARLRRRHLHELHD